MKKLKFNDINIEDFGFIVSEGASEILAQEEYELIKVEGSNGQLVINKGTYPDMEKTFLITVVDYIDNDDIEGMINNIKKIFFDITDYKLYYTYKDKYNIVKKVIFVEDVKTQFENFGDFTITFLCEPFYYITEEQLKIQKSTQLEETTLIFRNDGDFPSNPIIEVYGTGDLEFFMNGDAIRINNVDGYVKIDTKLLLCADQDNNNKINDFGSDFPQLPRGNNGITIFKDSLVDEIIITPRTIFR